MSTAARDGLMTEFKAARQAVMSNARCLTEGIDVPTVDMVAFLTPKRSKVDIVQAVGRAMRNAPGKTTGDILVPLYVEQATGESLDAAVARAEFDEVWAVLQALPEQDEVLDDLIHQMQAERRLTKGFNDSRLRERVEVLGPTLFFDSMSILSLLEASWATCGSARVGHSWFVWKHGISYRATGTKSNGRVRLALAPRPPNGVAS